MNLFIRLYDMAVKYKDMVIRQKEILRKLKEEDFNEEELSVLKDVEDYIDKTITDTYNGGEIWIDLSIAKFFYHPIKKKSITLNNIRREKMYKELLARYYKAGWKTVLHLDDGSEGNMSGGDYLIIKGNEK
jgi:hypothetical protein